MSQLILEDYGVYKVAVDCGLYPKKMFRFTDGSEYVCLNGELRDDYQEAWSSERLAKFKDCYSLVKVKQL